MYVRTYVNMKSHFSVDVLGEEKHRTVANSASPTGIERSSLQQLQWKRLFNLQIYQLHENAHLRYTILLLRFQKAIGQIRLVVPSTLWRLTGNSPKGARPPPRHRQNEAQE